MELGNFAFGNSRGERLIPRHKGYEEELYRLFAKVDPEGDDGRGPTYNNHVFSLTPYYWGDCTCGYDESPEYPGDHNPDCYQTALRKIKTKYKERAWGDPDEEVEIEALCKQHDFPFPSGCMVHCDCDFSERLHKWHEEIGFPGGCKPECMLRQPNFHYKPTDFRIEWYKYPLRDSYMSDLVTVDEFSQIIDKSIESVN